MSEDAWSDNDQAANPIQTYVAFDDTFVARSTILLLPFSQTHLITIHTTVLACLAFPPFSPLSHFPSHRLPPPNNPHTLLPHPIPALRTREILIIVPRRENQHPTGREVVVPGPEAAGEGEVEVVAGVGGVEVEAHFLVFLFPFAGGEGQWVKGDADTE